MDQVGPAGHSIILCLFFIVSFIFTGYSAAIQKINTKDFEQKKNEKNEKRMNRLLHMMEKPDNYLDTIQAVITLLLLCIGLFYVSYIGALFQPLFHNKYIDNAVAMLVVICALLVFCMLIPKRIGKRYAFPWAYTFVNFILFITIIFYPLMWVTNLLSTLLLRIVGIKDRKSELDVTEDEILSMVNEGHEQGVLQESEAQMITNIFELSDKEAKDVMINRQNMHALDDELSLQEATQIMLDENNSRFPVYTENIDHIVGIIHIKDAIRMSRKESLSDKAIKDIKELIRTVEFVPETKNINALFKDMQARKSQMVIVIDEYGQTSGIITMEDILEEIVGNIEDEYDEAEDHIEEKGHDEYVIEGMTPLDELEEKFGISFEEEEFETLNGYMISKLDRIPEPGDDLEVNIGDYSFKILEVQDNMIQEVLVTKKKNKQEA